MSCGVIKGLELRDMQVGNFPLLFSVLQYFLTYGRMIYVAKY